MVAVILFLIFGKLPVECCDFGRTFIPVYFSGKASFPGSQQFGLLKPCAFLEYFDYFGVSAGLVFP